MADNKDIREKVVREIEKTAESIRKKHRALKTGKIEEDIANKSHFKPIIEPLQKIVGNSSAIKDEPRDDVKTFSVQKREEDVKSSKRKRSSLDRKSKGLDASSLTPSETTVQPIMPELLANENVFETTDDSLAVSVQNQLQTPEGQKTLRETLREHLGPLSQKYVGAILTGDRESDMDHMYGVYLDKDGMMFGSKQFDVDKADNIIIDGVRYAGTPGLYELIFKRIPDDVICTEDDKQKYKSLLLTTNAHRYNHDPHDRIRANRGYKYKHVIAPLMSTEPKKKFGKGLPRAMTLNDNAIDYVHWDDPNELVDRLRLLEASRQSGHNAHDNEMLSIIEELREAGIIIN